jgi:hypothetical protein
MSALLVIALLLMKTLGTRSGREYFAALVATLVDFKKKIVPKQISWKLGQSRAL